MQSPFKILGLLSSFLMCGWLPPAHADDLLISEFCAVNATGITDEDGTHSDWIEIHNSSETARSLAGFHLTDTKKNLEKWRFPNVSVPGGGYLLVYASGKNRKPTDGHQLHTDFRLSGNGEYLALVSPKGDVLDEYSPKFPDQLEDVTYGWIEGIRGMLSQPTPGFKNSHLRSTEERPVIGSINLSPNPIVKLTPIAVSAKIESQAEPVDRVQLHYRVMYQKQRTVPMSDDGTQGDETAGDTIFTATVPKSHLSESGFGAGQMIRYFITAQAGPAMSRAPAYAPKSDSPEYFGTVFVNQASDRLPVFHWFVENPSDSGTRKGSRASIFFRGQFYDNVFNRIRGGTAQRWPKTSYKFDFNRAERFQLSPGSPRLAEVNLNTTVQDKAYLRETLAYETYRAAGVPAPEAFPVRVERNGEFFCVSTLVEQVDARFLKKHNLSPRGALYKAVDSRIEDFQKRSRRHEDDRDIVELLQKIGDDHPNREANVFALLDVPAVINYLAVGTIINDWDRMSHNYYLHRDTEGTGKWRMIPWDKDLTFGEYWRSDTISGSGEYSHPLLGCSNYGNARVNPVMDALYEIPRTREMYLRRLRTVMDTYLQPANAAAADRYFEKRIAYWSDALSKDAALDLEKWGSKVVPNQPEPIDLQGAVGQLRRQFLAERRNYLYVTHGPDSETGIPMARPLPADLTAVLRVTWTPTSASGSEPFLSIENTSRSAIDLSDHQFTGSLNLTLPPGTVIPSAKQSGNRMVICNNAAHFRADRGDAALFVQQHSEFRPLPPDPTLELRNATGEVVWQH